MPLPLRESTILHRWILFGGHWYRAEFPTEYSLAKLLFLWPHCSATYFTWAYYLDGFSSYALHLATQRFPWA